MTFGNNAKKDLLVLSFANALITVSMQNTNDASVRASNKNYSTNKKIDRRLDEINSLLEEVKKEMLNLGGLSLVNWINSNLSKRIGETLIKIQEDKINLEYLALIILHINFADNERYGKPLAEPMRKVQERMPYILETTYMFEDTEVGILEGEMYKQGHSVINLIKR